MCGGGGGGGSVNRVSVAQQYGIQRPLHLGDASGPTKVNDYFGGDVIEKPKAKQPEKRASPLSSFVKKIADAFRPPIEGTSPQAAPAAKANPVASRDPAMPAAPARAVPV